MNEVWGKDLEPGVQRQALAWFVHRYTAEHVPSWVKAGRPGQSGPYPVQFASDADWLAHTLFFVVKGQLSRRMRHCESYPTWPNNPELRGEFMRAGTFATGPAIAEVLTRKELRP